MSISAFITITGINLLFCYYLLILYFTIYACSTDIISLIFKSVGTIIYYFGRTTT